MTPPGNHSGRREGSVAHRVRKTVLGGTPTSWARAHDRGHHPQRPHRLASWTMNGMATHVALLRGINVGGRNKGPMADLREVVTSLGHTGVTTYIQSGNVFFTTDGTSSGELAAALESAITDRFGIWASAVVLSREA